MTTKPPKDLIAAIQSTNRFAVVGHAEPDGDCIGSQVALAHFLRRLGKEVALFSPGPFERPEIQPFESEFSLAADDLYRGTNPTVIVLDCSASERIGEFANTFAGLRTLVIDHHTSGSPFGNVAYIDTEAPSVTLLVQNIIEALGQSVDELEARMILFGLCTDTGFFRHLDSRDPAVFEAVARLNGAGATPHGVYKMIFTGRSLSSRVLLGRVMGRTEGALDGRVLITYETLEDKRLLGSESRDSDSLYQFLQATEKCEVVVFVREEDESGCTVGLRATGNVDVGSVAKSFGGGGHRKAAGFRFEGTRAAITKNLIELFSRLL